ncbi:MAG: family acetyltransferase [Nocardioidaceae bacterium]|nr:family acetyltransferase [Nocardioidaceae bacterium]
MIDLPYTPLITPLAAIEAMDLLTITDMISSETDPSRRHDDWHPAYPREDDLDGVGMVTDLTGWTSRQIRRLADGLVVGSIGFFGPPDDVDGTPEVEVGYGLVAEARGQGLMREVLPAVLTMTDTVGVRVRASTTYDNAASLASLRGAGFVVRSEDPDDLDRQVVLVRELPA